MSNIHSRLRSAFTLIELLIVMAIIALLMALLLPAVQAVRESATRTTCMNNMKQMGTALLSYHNAHMTFPYSHTDANTPNFTKRHGWVAQILPELDQELLFRNYKFNVNWDATGATNNLAVIATQLKVFQCPSADPDRLDQDPTTATIRMAASDYAPTAYVHRSLADLLLYPANTKLQGVIEYPPGPLATDDPANVKPTRLSDITDGVSHTIMVIEDNGRPAYWVATGPGNSTGTITPSNGKDNVKNGRVLGAGWADEKNDVGLYGVQPNLQSAPGLCLMNCTNNNEIYSFHRAGCNFLFADGSVKFLPNSTSPQILAALVTKAANDAVSGIDN
jgi:prepilin-type N-terminal cleavage/methylation domain-containing protein/prepilin-type processing-associated H-X9-DG protein